MSDQLFPEDILNARQTIRSLAVAAKEAADHEEATSLAAEKDALIEDIWEFVTYKLRLPDYLLEDVSFRVDQHTPSRPRVNWTIDDLAFRAYYVQGTDGLNPCFEVNARNQMGVTWKRFSDLESLGRLLA